jgi:hypothetical protein
MFFCLANWSVVIEDNSAMDYGPLLDRNCTVINA